MEKILKKLQKIRKTRQNRVGLTGQKKGKTVRNTGEQPGQEKNSAEQEENSRELGGQTGEDRRKTVDNLGGKQWRTGGQQ